MKDGIEEWKMVETHMVLKNKIIGKGDSGDITKENERSDIK